MSVKKKWFNAKNQLIALLVVAVVGFALLLIYQRELLVDTWDTLKGADLRFVLLLPLLQVVNYFFIGSYYRKMFALFGTQINVMRSWGVVAAMNFVNQILPSGGLSGITYLAYGFRASIETGKTTLIQIGRYMFAFASYALLSPIAWGLILLGGRSEELGDLADTASESWLVFAVVLIFFALMGLVVATFLNENLARRVGRVALRFVNWANRSVFRRSRPVKLEPLRQLNREFRQGTQLVKEKGMRAVYPGVFMLLSVVMEITIVHVALLAVGGDVGIGPVFLAFVAANIVGVVSVIPGDVGVHEATIILVLVAFGVSEPVAISTTLLYRVFNKFIFLPIGFFFYARLLKPAVEGKELGNG